MSVKRALITVRRATVRTTFLILVVPLMLFPAAELMPEWSPIMGAEGALTQIAPIVIEGNSGFASHPRVTGGGTISDPYIISDYLIDCSSSTRAAIAIRNSTAFFVVKNVTIRASTSSPGILTRGLYQGSNYQPMNGRFENVTMIGGQMQVYMERPIRMVFVQCNFSNPSGTGNVIRLYGGYDNTFDRNTFDCPDQDLLIEYYSYMFHIRKNSGSFRDFKGEYFRYSDVSNNTLRTRSWGFYSGYSSDFQGNDISSTSSTMDLLSFVDSHRIKVANNSLQGGKYSIYISHPNTYSPVSANYYVGGSYNIEFNRLNGSNTGIYLAWLTGYSLMAYLNLHHNRITNCVSYGIYNYYTGSATNRLFRNIFEFNRGTGTTYSPSASQAFDGYGGNSWSDNGVGNFWRDKSGPDDDSDGFVDDMTYTLSGWGPTTKKDPAPVSNPYFDFDRPVIALVEPKTRMLDAGYVNLSWTSYDNSSGMVTVQLRFDDNPWTNRSPVGSFGFKVTSGSHRMYLRAVDRAGLRTTKEVSLFVTSEKSPVTITSPDDGGFYDSAMVQVNWSFSEGFVPVSMTSKTDSGAIEDKDPQTPFAIVASEGFHSIMLTFEDAYGNIFSPVVGFAVDMTPPELDLLYPSDGVVIANPVVNFKWVSTDLTGISVTELRLDDEESNFTDKDFFSVRVDEGAHTFTVIVTDMAGNRNEEDMSFWVKSNTSLHIKSPLLDVPTSVQTHRVEWEYLSDFVIGSLTAMVDNNDPVVLPPERTHFDVTLTKDGMHYITVRALDPVKNEISDRIGIVLDRTPPDAGFLSHEDGAFVNTDVVDLEWNALETHGLEGYSLYLDGKLLASGLKDRTRTVRMSEGVHDVGLEAMDVAGNVGRANITIIVDLRPPVVSLEVPDGNIVRGRYHTFRWTVEDDRGILGSYCSLDGEDLVDLGELLSRDLMFDREGHHQFKLICVDLAGNNETIVVDLLADFSDPTVRFLNGPSGHIREWSGIISWEASDSVGIGSLVLSIDGSDIQLSVNASLYLLELSEGPHNFNLTVVDLAGNVVVRHVSFILDKTPPKVEKALGQAILKGDRASITWVLSEGADGLTVEVLLDNQSYPKVPDLTAGEMEIGPLSTGEHSIEMLLTDLAGNRIVLRWEVTVSDIEGRGGGGGSEVWPLVLLAILFLIVAGSVIFVLFFRKRKGKSDGPRQISAPKRPDRIKVGGTPITPAPVQVVSGSRSDQNMPKGQLLDDGAGPSYYRPEKASKRKAAKREHGTDMDLTDGSVVGAVGPEMPPPADARDLFMEGSLPVVAAEEPEMTATKVPPASDVDQIEEWGADGFEEVEELEELEEVEGWED